MFVEEVVWEGTTWGVVCDVNGERWSWSLVVASELDVEEATFFSIPVWDRQDIWIHARLDRQDFATSTTVRLLMTSAEKLRDNAP